MFQKITNYANLKSIDNVPLWYFVFYSKHALSTLIGLCFPMMAPLIRTLFITPFHTTMSKPNTHTPSKMHYNIDFSLLVLDIYKESQILLRQPSANNHLVNTPFSMPLSPSPSTLHLQTLPQLVMLVPTQHITILTYLMSSLTIPSSSSPMLFDVFNALDHLCYEIKLFIS
jgi:hypothetical protein